MAERFSNYGAFWLHYLREHAQPRTRALHYAGTIGALVLLGFGIVIGPWWLILLAPLAGYVPAWFAHSRIERNRSLTFIHPVWSLLSDVRMVHLWATGKLGPELKGAGIDPTPGSTSENP